MGKNKVGDNAAPDKKKEKNFIQRFIENRLIGNFDSADFSEPWRRKFGHAPTWCDADMAMQQINLGAAKGNCVGLYSRAFFQYWLFHLGATIQRLPWTTIIVSLVLYTACLGGLQDVIIETDIVKLWVSQDGRLNEELNFLNKVQEEASRIKRDAEPSRPELPRENGLGGGFQVVIQTPTHEHENVLSREALLKHVDLMEEISKYEVHLYGEKWTLADICFKPPGPSFQNGPLAKVMSTLLDKIIPCIWITPIDCYWEGAKPLGPYPPLNLGEEVSAFVSSLPKGNVTWKNLNPTAVMQEVGNLFDLGPIGNFFERAGIGAAYLDRPCIDPLDKECPKTAPNYFDRCTALEKFTEWNMAREDRVTLEKEELPKEEDEKKGDIAESIINDIFGRKKREASKDKKDDDYYDYDKDSDYEAEILNSTSTKKKETKSPKEIACLQYGNSLLKWMKKNPTRWGEFLTKSELPREPDYGKVMTGGCKGFGKNIMEWPEDLIIGGIKRGEEGLQSAEALQSVFLVAGAHDVYLRFKDGKNDRHPNLDIATWNPGFANEILTTWQRNFTKKLYNHKANFETENNRVFHPLASTSIADMLEEFSQFNYFIILMGYVLMIIYAAWTQARWHRWWLSVQSNVFLSFIGVFLVTYSSICGLGVTTWFGINFNAATTQIVPFLTLGLGIDDMFLLLHNYDEIRHISHKNEMGILLKETGLSVMITSANNILAFCAGYVLPIPALRSFCSQTAVLLFFNLASLVLIFPGFIALDLKRMRAGKRDLLFCGKAEEPKEKTGIESNASSTAQLTQGYQPQDFERDQPWYTVGGFLTNIYIPCLKKKGFRWFIIILTFVSVIAGLYGMKNSTLGLELSDVLPENTPPAAFLRAREKYFSFYPMFAVLRGQTIDIPNQQELIEEYREALGESHFMIKAEGKLQPYWMSLLRTWLQSLDSALEKELKKGTMDAVTGLPVKGKDKPAPEALIARRLVCSFGKNYNCTGRIGHIKLVNDKGIINPEGFYNYLTGWYNVDNMMYYVSQASFFPNPPGWAMGAEEKVVPAAKPLLYSQIPYYQTDLTDTPPIVKMIEEIRGTCEKFTAKGLPNFPSGLAFTFWEQYLTLRWNLFLAICIIAFSVFAVISVMMFNPWAAAMVMIIVVIITIELGGFMGLLAIKMNPISAVTLICAVGIGVEFTAHVVLCFMTALGTVHERLESCLQHMFVPVFHGAISTLLGIVMLVFSEFDFVIKYFFVVMSVLVMLGIFNGLCLLPVMLIMWGPECELQPVDNSRHLPAPPPLAEQKKKKSNSVESGLRQRRTAEVEMSESPPLRPSE